MSAPETKQQWQDFAEELAAFRAGRPVETFGHALGFDPESLAEWAADDAVDTLRMLAQEIADGTPMAEAVASALATHTHIGVEIGLFLAQSGRVTA